MIKVCLFLDKICCVSAAILVCVFTALPAEIINDSVSIENKTGFDTIAGDLPGVVIAKSTPYLVVSDIYSSAGENGHYRGPVFLF